MIIYQIYPRSFYDTNGDGIGDLAGITAKLSYIKSLGVDAIWISPFFKSPMKDFGYDVANYRQVDPIFGSMDDFKLLMEAARSLGLQLMVDMVISHTSEEHQWFRESRLRENDKSSWYLWADPKPDGSPPNNWVSVFGGAAWRWDAERRQYYFHSFFSSQPDLNMHNRAVQDQVLEEMKFWLDMGVSGFRFDASNHLFQDLLLRDNPPRDDPTTALHPYGFQVHQYDQGRPETLPFLERVRGLLDAYGAYSLAEVGGHDPLGLMGQYTRPGRLHSAYSFALMQADASAACVRRVIATLEENIGAPGVPCYATSNHDKTRVATRWQHGRDLEQTAKEMLALLFCMHGDICLYQGEELGLPQADVPFESLQDPFGITFWPKFKGRDGCRTPMPWSDAPFGGFSPVKPWLPVVQPHLERNVARQDADPDSVLNFSRRMLALRKDNPALANGSIELIDDVPDGMLGFLRCHEERRMLCLFNMENLALTITAPSSFNIALSQNMHCDAGTIHIAASGFCILDLSI